MFPLPEENIKDVRCTEYCMYLKTGAFSKNELCHFLIR